MRWEALCSLLPARSRLVLYHPPFFGTALLGSPDVTFLSKIARLV